MTEWLLKEAGGNAVNEPILESQEQVTPQDEGAGQQAEPWKQELESMKTSLAEENRQNSIRMLAHLSEIVKQNRQTQATAQPQAPAGVDEEKLGQMYQAAQENPAILPAVIKAHMESSMKSEMSKLKGDIADMMAKREADTALQSKLAPYADDFTSAKSKIMPQVPEAKRLLARFLNPEVVDSEIHDRLAYLLAAGSNPQAIGERESARLRAEEESREQQRQRMTALSGGGIGGKPKEPELDDIDRQLFAEYDMDINDPKVVKEILEAKKTAKLAALDGSNVVAFQS